MSQDHEVSQEDQDWQNEQDGQDQIVVELAAGVETLSEEEFDELYDQLDDEHKWQVDDNAAEFADNAVGDPSWRL